MNYSKEIEKLRRDIERANQAEQEARMTRYFAYERIAELQKAAQTPAEAWWPQDQALAIGPGEDDRV